MLLLCDSCTNLEETIIVQGSTSRQEESCLFDHIWFGTVRTEKQCPDYCESKQSGLE